ncbi:MAG: BMP family ABC transporter substrate-binding protein [Lachnospiraceae bacterium]|nr:BMP family ABC transporter substrate-binding protein [Lachnospiraceae bacterium]
MKKIAIISLAILSIIIVGIFFITGRYLNQEQEIGTTKVGILYNGEVDDKGWGQSHYEGINKSANDLNFEIIYKENVPYDESCMEVMENMINEGCEVIICNSFNYGEWIVKVAEKYPDVVFLHATGTETSDNITTYFGRIYQMRYLSGVLAGLQTESNEIGYVAAFPISEVNRGINAFTIGVKSVNPDATVHVIWTESWTDYNMNRQGAEILVDECGVDIIAMHCDSVAPLDVAEEKGVWSIGYNMDNSSLYPNSFLTAPVWNWSAFYTPQIEKYMQGRYYSESYWLGSESGLIELAPLTANVKPGIANVVSEKKAMLDAGTYDVFYGPVVDNEGNIRIPEGENMPDEVMLNSFDWYVEGVKIYEE